MPEKKLSIALDLDGPVIDWTRAAKDWCLMNVSGIEKPTPTVFNFAEEWGLTKDQWKEMFAWANEHARIGHWFNPEVLRGHEIHVITARNPIFLHDWIIKTINPTSLWMNGTPENKRLYAFRVRADFIYDDCTENLRAFNKAATVPIANTQPWNTDWDGHRADTIEEAIELFQSLR